MTGAASRPGGRRVSNSCSGQRSAQAGALFHHSCHIVLLPPVGPWVHDGHLGGDSRAVVRTGGAGTRGPHTMPGARGLEPALPCPSWPEHAPGPPALCWAPTLTLHEERLVWPARLPPAGLRLHRPHHWQLICPPERVSRDGALRRARVLVPPKPRPLTASGWTGQLYSCLGRICWGLNPYST